MQGINTAECPAWNLVDVGEVESGSDRLRATVTLVYQYRGSGMSKKHEKQAKS